MPRKKAKYVLYDSKTKKPVTSLSKEERDDLEGRLISQWDWCTDDKAIMECLHFWVGSGRQEGRKIGQPFFLVSSPDTDHLVTFWEDEEGGMALNKGENERPLDMPFNRKTGTNMRGIVLEMYVKLEFIMDHLVLVGYGVYTKQGKPKEALFGIRRLNSSSKVRILKRNPNYANVNFAAIERIRKFRNQLAHQFSLNNIEYSGFKFTFDNDKEGWKFTEALNDDYETALTSLLRAYYANQSEVIIWLLEKVKPA